MDEVRVVITSDADTVVARQRGREVADRLGFSRTDATFVATAISEIARNITAHAGAGEIVIREVVEGGRRGLEVVARDDGPGIADVESVLRDDFRSGGGLGMGLWGARQLMDEVRVESVVGDGTTVTMTKWCGVDEVSRLLGDELDGRRDGPGLDRP
jgi:serine/threonine-protein kinase RsbT